MKDFAPKGSGRQIHEGLTAVLAAGRAEARLTNNLMLGAPGRIRTHDPLVRSQVLYPTELRALLCVEITTTTKKLSLTLYHCRQLARRPRWQQGLSS